MQQIQGHLRCFWMDLAPSRGEINREQHNGMGIWKQLIFYRLHYSGFVRHLDPFVLGHKKKRVAYLNICRRCFFDSTIDRLCKIIGVYVALYLKTELIYSLYMLQNTTSYVWGNTQKLVKAWSLGLWFGWNGLFRSGFRV